MERRKLDPGYIDRATFASIGAAYRDARTVQTAHTQYPAFRHKHQPVTHYNLPVEHSSGNDAACPGYREGVVYCKAEFTR